MSSQMVQVEIRDPAGNPVLPGAAGVSVLRTANSTSYRLDVAQVFSTTPYTLPWQIRIQGTGVHFVNATADSGLHFDYLGRRMLPAGRPAPFRVRLATDAGAPAVLTPTVTFGLARVGGAGVVPLNLFDDGQHNDGAAGDGIYGGPVAPPAGLWIVTARGTLVDGTPIRRLDPTPIRVRRLQLGSPPASNRLPGTTVNHTFSLTNEEPEQKTFEVYVTSSQGWAVTGTVPLSLSVGAGQTAYIQVPVVIPAGAALGAVEETSLAVAATDDLSASDLATVEVTVVEMLATYLPAISTPP